MWRLTRPFASKILDDPKVQLSLGRYVSIVKGEKKAKFLIDRSLDADFSHEDSTADLWEAHKNLLTEYERLEQRVDKENIDVRLLSGKNSFLDLKVELGKRVMQDCHFCERACRVDRISGEKGYCRGGNEFAVSSCFPHLGEEPELVPSGTVFTLGCSIRCIHCQNWSISQWKESGTWIKPKRMAGLVERLREQGCRNLNMVGGDPTPNCWLWLDTMNYVNSNIATIWNSNSYYSRETAELLAGFVDVYLLDFKYGNNQCASSISDAPGYWDACTRNHLIAHRYGELIIRVLVLPEHNDCCTRPILKWISEKLGPWTRVNLMFQYRPEYRAHERKELRRRLNNSEIRKAQDLAREAGLKNLVRE